MAIMEEAVSRQTAEARAACRPSIEDYLVSRAARFPYGQAEREAEQTAHEETLARARAAAEQGADARLIGALKAARRAALLAEAGLSEREAAS